MTGDIYFPDLLFVNSSDLRWLRGKIDNAEKKYYDFLPKYDTCSAFISFSFFEKHHYRKREKFLKPNRKEIKNR